MLVHRKLELNDIHIDLLFICVEYIYNVCALIIFSVHNSILYILYFTLNCKFICLIMLVYDFYDSLDKKKS